MKSESKNELPLAVWVVYEVELEDLDVTSYHANAIGIFGDEEVAKQKVDYLNKTFQPVGLTYYKKYFPTNVIVDMS